MAGDLGADHLAPAGDDVEHADRRPGLKQRFRYHLRLDRAHLARLDDRRATGSEKSSAVLAINSTQKNTSVLQNRALTSEGWSSVGWGIAPETLSAASSISGDSAFDADAALSRPACLEPLGYHLVCRCSNGQEAEN
jgi:hypothetical protein